MEIGELVNLYRKQAGLTLDELADRSGVSKGALTKIIGGVTKAPTLDNMKAIARALGKNLADFDDLPIQPLSNTATPAEMERIKKYRSLDDRGKKIVDAVLDHEVERTNEIRNLMTYQRDNVIPLPRSVQKTSAGRGAYLGPEEMETIWVEENDLTRRASFCVPVTGDSMEPTYHDGDILLVEGREDIEPGQIGVFTVDGDGYVKKRGKNDLISLNPEYAPIPLTENSWCNGLVIGVLDPAWLKEG